MADQVIKIRKGLDLPISGEPRQEIEAGPSVTKVAVLGPDYEGMRPTMSVAVGDQVKRGQPLFSDKKTPGVIHTSPGAGEVVEINRGAKRLLESVVVQLDGDEQVELGIFDGRPVDQLKREQVRDLLLESGLWTALKTRPYSKVPAPEQVPNSIFVTAIDTSPLGANPQAVMAGNETDFQNGLAGLSQLTEGRVFVCSATGSGVQVGGVGRVEVVEFEGPHPAGLPGTHIHFLDPVGPGKTVWHLNYQDLIAFGRLFSKGEILADRVIALAGPAVTNPRLLRVPLGASIDQIVEGELAEGENRIISGDVLGGRTASGSMNHLGRYHLQVSALPEGREREFLGWQKPGHEKFSVKNIFASRLAPGKKFAFTTSTEGSPRAMVPVGSYEQVVPMDILPTFLLRSLIVGDTERAQSLGCLELAEEDLGLCTYVCPGKYEYAPHLRRTLQRIEKEG